MRAKTFVVLVLFLAGLGILLWQGYLCPDLTPAAYADVEQAVPLLRPQGDRHVLTWSETINAVELPHGTIAGRAYDTLFWRGDHAIQPVAPSLSISGKATAAIPVRDEGGFTTLFVTVKAGNEGLDTGLAVYRLGPEDAGWGLAYERVFSETHTLEQNDVGPVLIGHGMAHQFQVLDDGTVTVEEGITIPDHWAHRLGDGTVVPIPDPENVLGIRYDPLANNYVLALGHCEVTTPVAEEEPFPSAEDVVTTAIEIGTTPPVYLDALLVSEVVKRRSGMEVAAITVEGDFRCLEDGPCTKAEIAVKGGDLAVPLTVESAGTYPVKGGMDQDVVVTVHLFPIEGATAVISAVSLDFQRIELQRVRRTEESFDLEAGQSCAQFDAVHPRRLADGGMLTTEVVEMPVPQAKLRRVFLEADLYSPLNVFALAADDPLKVLAFRRVEAPGWFSLAGGVYEPFRLLIAVPEEGGEAVVHGLALQLTWQGIY